MVLRIDAHQHFWTTFRDDYGWLTPELGIIYRNFLPQDLQPLLVANGIARTIVVQAAPSEAETFYLLDIAAECEFVAGVVGWVDFEADDSAERIAAMAHRGGIVGLRPMVQDIDDTQWLLRPSLQPAFDAMIAHGLRFDALIQPRHLPVMRNFVAQYPELQMVIDHGAKPDIATGALQPWADEILALAQGSNIYCKLSGLLTEAAPGASVEDLKPFVDVLLHAFSPERLIWGSDWPVLNLVTDYAAWRQMTDVLLADLSADDRASIRGGNAARFYGISE